MNAKCLLAAALGCLVFAGDLWAGNLTYNVVPTTLDIGAEHEYEVTGTLTTNGTLGQLWFEDIVDYIVDYEIDVTGPTGYTFSPSNPGAEVNMDFNALLEATSKEITFRAITYAAFLRFSAYEDEEERLLAWSSGYGQGMLYKIGDHFTVVGNGSNVRATRVPDPSAIVLTLLGMTAFVAYGRRATRIMV